MFWICFSNSNAIATLFIVNGYKNKLFDAEQNIKKCSVVLFKLTGPLIIAHVFSISYQYFHCYRSSLGKQVRLGSQSVVRCCHVSCLNIQGWTQTFSELPMFAGWISQVMNLSQNSQPTKPPIPMGGRWKNPVKIILVLKTGFISEKSASYSLNC